jgi:hypothetical protein
VKKKAKRKGGPWHASLDDHHREGKLLQPPFLRLKLPMRPSAWVQTRLPDQLWTSLLVTQLERDFGLEILRTVAKACQGEFKPGHDLDLTHTGLVSMEEVLAERILQIVCSAPGASEALRPLLLFDDLPGRELWTRYLPSNVDVDDWNRLGGTIASVLDHQSQEATDARWARVLFRVATGQMKLQSRSQFFELAEYPKQGDLRRVRPFIRATEIVEYPQHDYSDRDRWAESFWQQCLKRTPCKDFFRPAVPMPAAACSRASVSAALQSLAEAALTTTTTTAPDARHASAFGLAAYALGITSELLGIGVSQGILGRLGLRAILEAYVSLAYLSGRDDPALWDSYRAYGQGQAKLAMLKVEDLAGPPLFVTTDLLEQMASEDRAAEFVSINLGHWANADLRKLSELAGVKGAYDRIYPWTSAFVHSNWASVRAASMATCGSPLHRLHAVIQPAGNALDDALGDARDIVDAMLTIVERLYNVTLARVTIRSV